MKRLLVVVAVAGLATTAACSAQAKQPDPGAQATVGPAASSAQAAPGQDTPSGAMPGMSMPASAGQNPAESGPVSGTAVSIQSFAFTPATLTVKAGTKVTWTNHDQESHTVTSRTGAFHSPTLGNGGVFSYTFTKPGTYEYLCSIHPFMTATVVVTP